MSISPKLRPELDPEHKDKDKPKLETETETKSKTDSTFNPILGSTLLKQQQQQRTLFSRSGSGINSSKECIGTGCPAIDDDVLLGGIALGQEQGHGLGMERICCVSGEKGTGKTLVCCLFY